VAVAEKNIFCEQGIGAEYDATFSDATNLEHGHHQPFFSNPNTDAPEFCHFMQTAPDIAIKVKLTPT